ncbi:MAG: cache domain-containing protein [Proteobacteria bacterium]|nr:cache domain-containing protein [Pseudomonadota bacterium]
MVKSLRSRIIMVVTGIVFLTTMTIMFFVHKETEKAIFDVQDENARNVLNTVLLNVENEYKSLLFHRKTMIERRNAELNNVITIAFDSIEYFYNRYRKGEITESQAKTKAVQFIETIRYDNGVGYIWINDIGTPIPRMIMHPTIPELNGKILDDEKFNCALGIKKNLFQAFVDICTVKNEGYVDYLWPKPTESGLSEEKPKLSYGRLFKEWGWILGTGMYIDDIEQEIKKRHDAILKELQQTFTKIRVANSGYMYLFNQNQEMIIHPSLKGEDFSNLINPVTGNPILEDLIAAEKTKTKQIDYLWEKPPDFKKDFRFWKRSYVVYFEPLKWYIASSVYFDEKNKLAKDLQNKMFILSAVFIGVGLLLSLLLSKSLTTPLSKLMHAAKNIEKKGFSSDSIPITGTIETKELGTIFAHLIQSLQQGLAEKEVLLKEIHHRVKNNMAVVISLLGLQARNVMDTRIKDALEDSQNRIKSMALIHESLYRSTHLSEISLNDYTTTLINTLVKAMQKSKGKIETRINTDNVSLTIDQAVPFGLILNELVTNSLKYAFLRPHDNLLEINAQYTENLKEIKLVVRDNGPGFPENIQVKENKTLGLRIISLLVENQLEGKWDIKNKNGACFIIQWPIEKK